MKTIRFTVPPTHDLGSYTGHASASRGETLAASALWDYNSCRAHDGLPPLTRMPAGTVYHRPAAPVYINRIGGGYRETVDEFTTRKEARAMLAEYRLSDPAGDYYISSRPCKGWSDEQPAPAFQAARGGDRAPLDLAHPEA